MKLTIRHNNFINECRQIVGCALQGVEYTEVDYYPAHPQPCYATDHPQIHTVDFSVRLHFTNHKTFEISWKNFEILDEEEYNAYGLNIRFNLEDKKRLAGQRTWDVSKESTWQQLLGQPVQDVKIYWTKTWVETPTETKELNHMHPQAIGLFFPGNQTIFISIAEFQSGNLHKVVRGVNNLLVTTDESLARKTNMLTAEVHAV